jgi:PPOX class probable F420-dependent enzyme
MSAKIPESHKHLLKEPVFPKLATIMPDGRPQVHPVWSDYDGEHIRINTVQGRQKYENLTENEYATLLFVAPDDPYFWMEVRGHVAREVTGTEAEEHIDQLAQKYLGEAEFPGRQEGDVRVMFEIEPDRVLTHNS